MYEGIWQELRIPPTDDVVQIRRAYASRVREVHPEDDPAGFQRLREAYEWALLLAPMSVHETDKLSDDTPADDIERAAIPHPAAENAAEQQVRTDARAAEIVESIMAGIGKENAPALLSEILQSEEFENIELQMLVEEALVNRFSSCEPLPYRQVELISQRYGWRSSISTLNKDYRVQELLRRVDAWQAYDRLLNLKAAKVRSTLSLQTSAASRLQVRSATVLTGTYKPLLFEWYRLRYPGLLKSVHDQLRRLEMFAPATIAYHLDANTVKWWREREVDPFPAMAKVFGVFFAALVLLAVALGFWPVTVVGIVCFGVLRLLKPIAKALREHSREVMLQFGLIVLAVFLAILVHNNSEFFPLWPLSLIPVSALLIRFRSRIRRLLVNALRLPVDPPTE